MERTTQVESAEEMIHGGLEDRGGAMASMFVTVEATNRMGQEILARGYSTLLCDGKSFTSDIYSHAIVNAIMDAEKVDIKVEFVTHNTEATEEVSC